MYMHYPHQFATVWDGNLDLIYHKLKITLGIDSKCPSCKGLVLTIY